MKHYPDTDTFHFVNVNSHNRKTCDCVYRAIADAFGITWEEALRACVAFGLKRGIAPNDHACYGGIFKSLCIDKEAQPRKPDDTKFTGSEFCREYATEGRVFIAHLGGNHVVAIKNGKVNDIWNSTGSCIGNYWEIPTDERLFNALSRLHALAESLK